MRASKVLLSMAAFIIVVAGMRAAADILVPFLLSAFIALLSASPLFWMQKKGWPEWLALTVVISGIILSGILVALLAGSSVMDFSADLPVYEEKLRQQTEVIVTCLNNLGIDTSKLDLANIINPGAVMKFVASGLKSVVGVLKNGFLILLIVVFMLLEATSIPAKLTFILKKSPVTMKPFEKFISNVEDYMAIKTLVSLVTGILVTIWVFILGVDYPLLWGLLAFALNYVPNIGSIFAAVPAVLLATIQVGFIKAIILAFGYIVINIIVGSVIEPRLLGRGLGLSPLVVFLSLLFWGWVLGPVGMLLSVPLTITAKIALDSGEGTRWLAVLLGPEIVAVKDPEHIEE
jgi:AI-2 transport protein TqsA